MTKQASIFEDQSWQYFPGVVDHVELQHYLTAFCTYEFDIFLSEEM